MRRFSGSRLPVWVLTLLLVSVWAGCGDKTAPPAEEKKAAPAEEKKAPAAEEKKAPAADEKKAPAADEKKAAPADEKKAPAEGEDKAGKAAPTAASAASLDAGNKAILANAKAFDVAIKSYDKGKKMRILRALRKYASGSKLRDIVVSLDKGTATVATGLSKEEAEAAMAELRELGAVVELKASTARAAAPAVVKDGADLAAAPKGIEGCPTKGPANARVTLVEFTDYQ